MATPAVNITENTSRSVVSRTWNRNTPQLPWTPGASQGPHSVPATAYRRSRPASVETKWAGDPPWRPMRNWNHESAFIEVATTPISTVWNNPISGRPLRQSREEGDRNHSDLLRSLCKSSNNPLQLFCLTPEMSSLISKTETKALDNLKLGDVKLGETFAQWRQTARMFSNAATRVASDVRGFRKRFGNRWKERATGKPKPSRRGSDCRGCKVSQLWLELVYGWVPLISDVYGSVQMLEHLVKTKGLRVRTRASSEDQTSTRSPRLPFASGGVVTRDTDVYITGECSHKCGVVLWYELSDLQVAMQSGLGLINPVELAWDLVPYSFVVDWLLPIGPWLASFTADSGFKFLDGARSYKREVVLSTDVVQPFLCKSRSNYVAGDTAMTSSVYAEAALFKRTVYANRPVPGLYFKNPLSVRHVLNATALLRLAFR